jgi:hypothetical protein
VENSSPPILERQQLRCYNGIMKNDRRSFAQLTDKDLLDEVRTLASRERQSTARLIASLAELDARRLYLGEGFSSLFTYCTQCLHLSEHAAYGRIQAARAACRFPLILQLLEDGSITLTTVGLLAPLLTDDNHEQVLAAAQHRSKREVEVQAAALRPLPPVPSTVRKLPAARPSSGHDLKPDCSNEVASRSQPTPVTTEVTRRLTSEPAVPPVCAAVIAPLAPERYRVQLTVSRETHDKLRRVQDLLRHSIPDGDPAVVFDRALTVLLGDLERKKHAATNRPAPIGESSAHSRHIPASVRRQVWERDGGQCAFVGSRGRCSERGLIEFHHVMPFADGGTSGADNIQLRCRAHNAYESQQYFCGTVYSLSGEAAQAESETTGSGPS